MRAKVIALIAASFSLVACADAPTLGEVGESSFELIVADAAGEVATHIGNLHVAVTMHDVALERGRHAGAAELVWAELRVRLEGIDGCADAGSRAELWQFMRGLEATERGHLAALERVGNVEEARRISEIYAAGADDLFARMSYRWSATGCAAITAR